MFKHLCKLCIFMQVMHIHISCAYSFVDVWWTVVWGISENYFGEVMSTHWVILLMLCRNRHQALLLSHTNRIVRRPGNGEIGNNFFRAILRQYVKFENITNSGFHVKILDTCSWKKVWIPLKHKFLFWRMSSRIRKQDLEW